MTGHDDKRLRVGEVAKRLGVSAHLVHQLWREGVLPTPDRSPGIGWNLWRAADIEQAVAADVVGARRKGRVYRRPNEEALARKYAMRRRYVELEGRIRTEELAAEFDVSVSQARNVLRGQRVGDGRYDRLQDDGLQPVIDELRSRADPRAGRRAAPTSDRTPGRD
jgi:predicted DNA-binding transcriptional regulator AlpA